MDNWKRVFAIIWTGQFLSILTSSIVNFAIVLWLSLETGSAEVLAFATMAALLPQSVLGLFTGIFIDRWKRKRVMIMADSFIAFCTLILAVLFYFDMKMTNILLLDVAGAAFACLSLCFVFIPDPSHEERNSELHLWREAKEAIMEVRNQYGLSWLFLLSILATFVIMPVSVLFPLMTLNHFAGNAFQVSLVEVSWGGGALLAGALLGLKKYRWNEILLINGMYIALGLTFLFSGLLPVSGFIWFAVLTALGGVCGSLYFATFTTVIQSRIDPGVMGRVFSFYMSFSMLPSMIGLLSTGFLADSIGLGNTFIISGGFLCLIGIISFFIPSLISLKESFKR